jgi:hypothetical protein
VGVPRTRPGRTARAELRASASCWRPGRPAQGAEAHFFLIDPQGFARGERDSQLSSDDCGTTQHYLLLDEFYRTAIWLGARRCGGWCRSMKSTLPRYTHTLLSKRFIRSTKPSTSATWRTFRRRVRRRRPVATVQGHRVALQVAARC